MKPFRRLMVLPVVFFLLWQILPAQAAEPNILPAKVLPEVKSNAAVTPTISLEQAIKIVKENFEVAKELTDFNSGYNVYNNRQTWSLHWNSNGMGSFDANVDVVTGEIVSVYSWKQFQPSPALSAPKLSQEEARDKAEQMLKKLLPTKFSELEFIPNENEVITLNNYGPFFYNLRWQRIENNVAFPGNGVNVQVNGDDGQITSYNLNWTELQFPQTTNAVSQAKANEVFKQNNLLELQYIVPQFYRPMATGTTPKVLLVYQLKNNGAIDAISGQPLKLSPDQWISGDESMAGGMGGEAALKGAYPLNSVVITPEERTEIEKNAKLLTQEQALAVVKSWVGIPENLTLRSASLYSDGILRDNKIWTFDWNTDKYEPNVVNYMSARVDAVTGELIGYSISPTRVGNEKVDVSKAEAQSIAENFIKKIQPQKFQEAKLDENGFIDMKGSVDGVYQNFNYVRYVKGIPFSANGFNLTVDTVSKTVTNYNMNWWKVDFPDPAVALAKDQAVDKFLEARPLTLKYAQVYQQGNPSEVRLLYQPQTKAAVSNLMDAKTGEFLDWQGKPIAKLPRPYKFTDIAGNFAEKEISLLGRAGIFGENKDKFMPDEKITNIELLKAVLMARNGAWFAADLSDEDILKNAKQQGWLKEDVNLKDTVSRENLVKLMIRMQRLEYVAQLQGVFQVNFEDVNTIAPSSVGYVALAKGLGILKDNGTKFAGDEAVTRAEAAYTLVKALNLNQL